MQMLKVVILCPGRSKLVFSQGWGVLRSLNTLLSIITNYSLAQSTSSILANGAVVVSFPNCIMTHLSSQFSTLLPHVIPFPPYIFAMWYNVYILAHIYCILFFLYSLIWPPSFPARHRLMEYRKSAITKNNTFSTNFPLSVVFTMIRWSLVLYILTLFGPYPTYLFHSD